MAAFATGEAVSRNGPAQLMTTAQPAKAFCNVPGSSMEATRESGPCGSRAKSRPTAITSSPRSRASSTTKRPVCPPAPKMATAA